MTGSIVLSPQQNLRSPASLEVIETPYKKQDQANKVESLYDNHLEKTIVPQLEDDLMKTMQAALLKNSQNVKVNATANRMPCAMAVFGVILLTTFATILSTRNFVPL